MTLRRFKHLLLPAALAALLLPAACNPWATSDGGLLNDGDMESDAFTPDGDLDADTCDTSRNDADDLIETETEDEADIDSTEEKDDGGENPEGLETDTREAGDAEAFEPAENEPDSAEGEADAFESETCCSESDAETIPGESDAEAAEIEAIENDGEPQEVDEELVDSPQVVQSWPPMPTGQNKCYNDSDEIACPAPGADFYGQDAQYPDNARHFTVREISGERFYEDSLSGLFWADATMTPTTYSDAVEYCDNLIFAGLANWRLPDTHELRSLVSYGRFNPASEFPSMPANWFWSSTLRAENGGFAWGAHLGVGYLRYDDLNHLHNSARCVYKIKHQKADNAAERFNISEPTPGELTVYDSVSGLSYALRFLEDQNWRSALAACENLTYATFSDWRLPNINELAILADYGRSNPAAAFPQMPPAVMLWSSTSYVGNPAYAWYVYFADSRVHAEVKYYQGGAALCVRN